jgi:hypothetical protein
MKMRKLARDGHSTDLIGIDPKNIPVFNEMPKGVSGDLLYELLRCRYMFLPSLEGV